MKKYQVTSVQLVEAFDEWLRRYNEDPEGYAAEYPTDGSYGETCSSYLLFDLLNRRR